MLEISKKTVSIVAENEFKTGIYDSQGNEHSILSPSSFPRLVACPGSRKLEAMFPREESEAAAEGILAHEYASKWLEKYFSNESDYIYSTTTDYFMDECINLYIDHIVSKVKNNEKPHIEERIYIPYLHPECFGTPDCWYYDEEKNEVHVWDFKYGFKPVEVRENWQLIGYASGVISKLIDEFISRNPISNVCAFTNSMIINLHIVQPRARHREGAIRTWSLTRDALRYYEDELRTSIQSSFLENPFFEVGSHCTYCKAKSICPQLKKESNMIVDEELEIERNIESPSIDYIEKKLMNNEFDVILDLNQSILDTRRSIEILKLRLETLEKQAIESIQAGMPLQGFTAKKVWGRLGWNIPVKEVQSLGEELGLNFTKPAKVELITPIQAMKLAKKDEAIKERIKSLASCKFNGYKLVAEGDDNDDEEVNFDDL